MTAWDMITISVATRAIKSRIEGIVFVTFSCHNISVATRDRFMQHICLIWNIFVRPDDKDIQFQLLSANQKQLFRSNAPIHPIEVSFTINLSLWQKYGAYHPNSLNPIQLCFKYISIPYVYVWLNTAFIGCISNLHDHTWLAVICSWFYFKSILFIPF